MSRAWQGHHCCMAQAPRIEQDGLTQDKESDMLVSYTSRQAKMMVTYDWHIVSSSSCHLEHLGTLVMSCGCPGDSRSAWNTSMSIFNHPQDLGMLAMVDGCPDDNTASWNISDYTLPDIPAMSHYLYRHCNRCIEQFCASLICWTWRSMDKIVEGSQVSTSLNIYTEHTSQSPAVHTDCQ